MLKAIKHGLGNLLNFTGRDARQAFWYYVLFVYVVVTIVTLIVVMPIMLQAIFEGIRQGIAAGQSGDPVQAQIAAEAGVANAMSSTMSTIMWTSSITNLLMMALLAASVVRRLHDSDLPGWWALVPGAIFIVNLFLAPVLMQRMMENLGQMQSGDPAAGMAAMQGSVGAASLLGWAAIIIVVVFGVRKSTSGPNRYGGAPFVA